MLKRYDVDLTQQERGERLGLLNTGIGLSGAGPACTRNRTRFLHFVRRDP